MIDLHSHLLPGVDDGSRSVEQSLTVLRELARHGVTDLCLTPHLLASRADQGVPEAHERAWAALNPHIPDGVRLHRGAEVMLDRPLGAAVGRDRVVTIAGSRYLLVEFPRLVTSQTVHQALSRVAETGVVPLLAHPERYSSCAPETVRWWKQTGAVMQVDAISIITSGTRGEKARKLVAHGLADILAADNHGDHRSVLNALEVFEDQGGAEQAALLLRENPRAILEDRATSPVPAFAVRVPLVKRIRDLFGREER